MRDASLIVCVLLLGSLIAAILYLEWLARV